MSAVWDRIVFLTETMSGVTGEEPPLYGEPGALDDSTLVQLVRRVAGKWQSDPRKREQALRERMLESEHSGDISDYISKLYKPSFARRLVPHVSTVGNPFDDVTSQVVQLYRGNTLRRIDGVSDAQQMAFQKFVRESMIAATAQRMAEIGWGVGPQHVVPEIRRNRIRLLTPSPSTTDEVLDIEDPTGDPVAVAYPSGKGEVTVVDGVSYRTFTVTSSGMRELEGERRNHGLGDTPVATLRFAEPTEASDWHLRGRNRRLVEATLIVGHLLAKLSHTRKGQGGKLLAIVGNTDGIARGQSIGDPVAPVLLRESNDSPDDPRRTTIQALEFDTDPANTIKHIRHIWEWGAESTGVQVTVDASGSDKFDMKFDFDRLAELRGELVWWAETWERALWTFSTRLAQAMGHPLSRDLPSPDAIEEGFYLQLPPMHRVFADPRQERDHWDWMMRHGQASFLDLGRRFMGNRSDMAIIKQIGRNVEINGMVWDEIAKRQGPKQLGVNGEIETLAEAQGAMGPAVRDGKMLPPGGGSPNDNEADAGG